MIKKRSNFDKNTVPQAFVFSLMLFWLAACGGGESEQGVANAEATNAAPSGETGRQGSAQIIVSEGNETVLDGDAMFMMQPNAGDGGLLLSLYNYQSDNDFIAISIASVKGEAKPGTYDIRDESDFKVAVIRNVAGVQSVGGPNAGQLGVFTSDSSRMTGSFLFYVEMVTGTDYENTSEYAVHGTFEAFKGEHADLPAGLR